jgi:hypothetical protein
MFTYRYGVYLGLDDLIVRCIMATLSIESDSLLTNAGKIIKLANRVNSIHERFARLRRALDWDVMGEAQLESKISHLSSELNSISKKLNEAGTALQDIKNEYTAAHDEMKELVCELPDSVSWLSSEGANAGNAGAGTATETGGATAATAGVVASASYGASNIPGDYNGNGIPDQYDQYAPKASGDTYQGTGSSGDKSSISSVSEFKEKFGYIINEMAKELDVEPNLLAGVILVESSGSGFVDGNLKIRFENHVFIGKTRHSDLFAYGSPKWKGHRWRRSTEEEWQTVHTGKQTSEYEAFKFALSLDEDAAYQSISMGMGQIMGFNHKVAGYDSAREMFEDFSKGHEQQIKGMITFFKGYNNGNMLKALQKGDLESFVKQYNGSGQVEAYTNLMKKRAEEYSNAK